MNPEEIARAAEKLHQAEVSLQQTGILSLAFPAMTMEDAYAVQAALVARKIATGRHQVGWKIGLTSRAMQMALSIDIPDSGVLLDDMYFENGCTIPAGRFIEPRIEAEIAFVLKGPLAGADITVDDVEAATDYVLPVLEILDTRIVRKDAATGKMRTVFDTISDNAANAGFVVGNPRHGVRDFDLRHVGAIVSRDGTVEETGLGAGVLNDPRLGLVWLARRLAAYGQSLKAGEIVLSGSFIRPVESPSGSIILADFGSFGSVGCTFG